MARTRALDYDAKRSAILTKAAELFARHGYAGASITMIGSACGISKALLYHYYPDKEAVLYDVLATHLKAVIAAVEHAATNASAEDRLFKLAEALLESYRDADAEHKVQLSNLTLLPADKQEALREMQRSLVSLFSRAIVEAEPALTDSPLLKPMTMSLFGMLNWHYLWFRDGKGLSRSDYARMVTSLLTAGAAEAMAAVAHRS